MGCFWGITYKIAAENFSNHFRQNEFFLNNSFWLINKNEAGKYQNNNVFRKLGLII